MLIDAGDRREMLATGVDIVEIERIAQCVDRWGDRFVHRVYTDEEIEYCRGRSAELAARFAAKEAIAKALGTGAMSLAANGVGPGLREIEVLPDRLGRPKVRLHGRAQERAQLLGMTDLAVSLSHSWDYAVAFVVAQQQPGEE